MMEIFAHILIITGGILMVISAMGCIKYRKNMLQTLHAAAVGDGGGLMLILLGVITLEGFTIFTLKIVLLIFIMLLTLPTSTHLLAKAARDKK